MSEQQEQRKTFSLNEDDFEEFIYGDEFSENWSNIIIDELDSSSRWTNTWRYVIKNNVSGEYYEYKLIMGKSETQDTNHFDVNDEVHFRQVFEKQITKTVYM